LGKIRLAGGVKRRDGLFGTDEQETCPTGLGRGNMLWGLVGTIGFD